MSETRIISEDKRGGAESGSVASTLGGSRLPLSALLSQALIAFTVEFDQEIAQQNAYGSLAMYACIVRFLGDDGVSLSRLRSLSGISKPGVAIAVSALERHGAVVVEMDPADNRTKRVSLTPRGRKFCEASLPAIAKVEQHWQEQFGQEEINKLRESLETVVSRLDVNLPHYPMALPHWGGTPTGL